MSNELIYTYPVNLHDDNSTYGIAGDLITPMSSVLDIGCFDGSFLEALKKKHRCKVAGVELNKVAIKKARQKGITVASVDLNNPDNLTKDIHERYDFITMLDVLEHLLYPAKILGVLPKLLNARGKILLSIPNINHVDVVIKLLSDGWQTYHDGLLDKTHTHFYSSRELKKELAEYGLYIESEHHITVPAGMTNLVTDHKRHMQIYEKIKPLLNNDEAYSFQKLFVISKDKPDALQLHSTNLSSPSKYIGQRIAVFSRMLYYDLKSRF